MFVLAIYVDHLLPKQLLAIKLMYIKLATNLSSTLLVLIVDILAKSPDPRAVATGSKYCISFDGIKARQLQQEDFANFDLILTMDHGHYTSAMELCPEEYKNKVHLLLQYCNVENSWDDEVFDPYYRSNSGFDEVFVMIDQAIKNLFEQEREKESF